MPCLAARHPFCSPTPLTPGRRPAHSTQASSSATRTRPAICSWESTSLPTTHTQSSRRSNTVSRSIAHFAYCPERSSRERVLPLLECFYEFRDGLGLRLGHARNALLVRWL